MSTIEQSERILTQCIRIAENAYHVLAERDIWPEAQPTMVGLSLAMCHENVCPVRLDEMLEYSEGGDYFTSVTHDLFGVYRHYDAARDVLTDCFLPRFADQQALEIAGKEETQ